ncbi:YncE family protein [Candidatus Parcubacteria bacterium]|nr:YncE family protein [Candidatus Parcubacteria bacterium]
MRHWIRPSFIIAGAVALAAVLFVSARSRPPEQPSLFEKPALIAIDEARDRFFVFNDASGIVVGLRASTREVIGRAKAAPRAQAMVLDPESGALYLTDGQTNSVVEIRPDNWEVRRIPVGKGPVALALDPTSRRLFAANFSENSVSLIDTSTARMVAETAVGAGPIQVALNPKTGSVYVANETSRSITVLAPEPLLAVRTVPLPFTPRYLVVDSARSVLYVAPAVGTTLVKMVEGEFAPKEIVVGRDPRGFALDAATGTLYVTLFVSGAVAKISPVGVVIAKLELPAGSFPGKPALDREGSVLYVPLTGSARVAVVDAEHMQIIRLIESGTNTDEATFNERQGEVYFVNPESDTLTVFNVATQQTIFLPKGADPRRVARRAGPVFDFPIGLAVNESDERVYVVNNVGGFLTVIEGRTQAAVRTIQLGRNPRAALYVSEVGKLYVASGDENVVMVLDRKARRVKKRIAVGQKPRTMRYDAVTRRLFVVNQDSNSVSVVDTVKDEVVQTISVGKAPLFIEVQPSSGRVAVVNAADNSVSIIDAAALREVGRVQLDAPIVGLVFPERGAGAVALTRSPSMVALIDADRAKLGQKVALVGDAVGIADTPTGVVIGQNLSAGAEIIMVDPESLSVISRTRLDQALASAGVAPPVLQSSGEVLWRDLASQRQLLRFNPADQTVSAIATLLFPVSYAAFNQRTGELYALHASQHAMTVVDVARGQAVRVVTNHTPVENPWERSVLVGAAALLLTAIVGLVGIRRFLPNNKNRKIDKE